MITQENLIDFLKPILDVENEITLQEFIKRVETAFILDPQDDLAISDSRTNEKKYVQRCRNLKSHDKFPSNCKYENQIFKKIK